MTTPADSQPATATLAGKTMVLSGGSRGIGLAIALRAAADGANIILIAKTSDPHPRLSGTIHTAAEQIRQAGGQAVPIVGDVRDDATLDAAVTAAIDEFGGIDICINNASVLNLAGTLELEPKRYDLMQDVNVRGTFMLSRACLPTLLKAPNPHILTLSPPLNLAPRWLGAHPGYLLAKYGMTLATLGFAAEFSAAGLAANCLWPRTTIATDAIGNLFGGDEVLRRSRTVEVMADASHVILTTPSRERSGETLIDEDVLRAAGVVDFARYAVSGADADLALDLFLD
jgi:citronellol/citronellal dehydrogenase